jgi:hypothetical protein
MKPWIAAIVATLVPLAGQAQTLARLPGEAALPFAERVLQLPKDTEDAHALETKWNGRPVIFVDFPRDQDRVVVALEQAPDGGYRKLDVTVGEEEGGLAEVAAVGFANADRDPAGELIVILAWPVQHAVDTGEKLDARRGLVAKLS